ncbi:hypothetical protein AAFF_G00420980 [Aldrovandia affinis]|uniref:Uncharacterized protein n=1 Tax=Aldrovandia affinis TaxID=143900 RepID=A0AAD7S9T5_9TELE|nr:hypothetical protein AAFF_G00420980 [Aldrovandia affinis]
MEKLGIVRRSNSPWASPLHMVPKSGGGSSTRHHPDRYRFPAQDFSARLAGKTVFSRWTLSGDIIRTTTPSSTRTVERCLTLSTASHTLGKRHHRGLSPKCRFDVNVIGVVGGGGRALGVRLHHLTAFHPQANGLCEHFHRSMKAAPRASLKGDSWTGPSPMGIAGPACCPKEDLQSSSAVLKFTLH